MTKRIFFACKEKTVAPSDSSLPQQPELEDFEFPAKSRLNKNNLQLEIEHG
jgi:hypothetical protein